MSDEIIEPQAEPAPAPKKAKKPKPYSYQIPPELLEKLKQSKPPTLTPQGLAGVTPKPKRSRPLEPISQETWDSLNEKAQWDTKVALRGPDLVNSDVLKFYTTSVIRYRLSGVMRVGGLVNSKLPFVVLPSDGSGTIEKFSASHFLGHIYEAASWLNIPVLYVPNSVFAKMFDTQYGIKSIAKLLKGIVTNEEQLAAIESVLEGGY